MSVFPISFSPIHINEKILIHSIKSACVYLWPQKRTNPLYEDSKSQTWWIYIHLHHIYKKKNLYYFSAVLLLSRMFNRSKIPIRWPQGSPNDVHSISGSDSKNVSGPGTHTFGSAVKKAATNSASGISSSYLSSHDIYGCLHRQKIYNNLHMTDQNFLHLHV